jgi:hypothetical protein
LSNKKRKRKVRNEGNGFMKGAVLALLEGTIGVILTVRYYRQTDEQSCSMILTKPCVVWPQASMTISAIELLQDYLRNYQVAGHSVAVVLLR